MPLENDQPAPDGEAQPAADATAQQQQTSSDEQTYSADDFRAAMKRRDAALAKAREAEAKLAEYEKREKQRALESMTLEQQKEALQQELESFRAEKAAIVRKGREDSFLSKVVEYTKVDAGLARALLLAAERDHGVEIAPDDFTHNDVKHAAALMRKLSPSLFEPKAGGAPTPAPGTNVRSLFANELPAADAKERWVNRARTAGSKNSTR